MHIHLPKPLHGWRAFVGEVSIIVLGVLIALSESEPEGQAWILALKRRLQELGWAEGRNVRIDYRWSGADVGRMNCQ